MLSSTALLWAYCSKIALLWGRYFVLVVNDFVFGLVSRGLGIIVVLCIGIWSCLCWVHVPCLDFCCPVNLRKVWCLSVPCYEGLVQVSE